MSEEVKSSYTTGYDKDDSKEEAFCNKRSIDYLTFSFGAGGPQPYEPIALKVLDHLDALPKPVWVHCEGGKDRTGGIIMRFMLRKGYTLYDIVDQCRKHKVPALGWLEWALKEKYKKEK